MNAKIYTASDVRAMPIIPQKNPKVMSINRLETAHIIHMLPVIRVFFSKMITWDMIPYNPKKTPPKASMGVMK